MTTQLLIYQQVVPVCKQKHKNWSVKTGTNYGFSKNINSVPLTAIEFPNAALEYTIIFAGSKENVMPAVILGVRDQENLYVSDSGEWKTKYVPAFLRRYPFVFSHSEDQQVFTLCIDEEFTGCNQEGKGERLFDADGEKTQYLENILNFSNQYQGHFVRTQAFCKQLKELDLLETMQAQLTLKTGQKLNLSGFQAVSRERLKNLSDQQLLALLKADELELIYLHLHSLKNLALVLDKAAEHQLDNSKAENEFEQDIPPKEDFH